MAKRRGTAGDDALNGGGGDDTLFGFAGNDVLTGGLGDDVLRPDTGSDRMSGGRGADTALIVELDDLTPDTFDGGNGFDTLDLSRVRRSTSFDSTYWSFDSQSGVFTVEMFGDPIDAPRALTFTNVEHVIGTGFDDLISVVSATSDMTIDAGNGDDWVRAGGGNVMVHAGRGDDMIDFGYGRVAFYGDEGDDQVSVASASRGLANGGRGIDTISASGDIDLRAGYAEASGGGRIRIDGFENVSLRGASDGATAWGDDRDNVLTGDLWPADYVFYGRGGADTLVGGDGADRLDGGLGSDVLDGAFGADVLTGGAGADVFRFADDVFSRAAATDTIADFARSQGDKIDVAGIDANPATFENDALRWLGTTAFDGAAGGLRFEVRGAETFVQIDLDGNGAADLEIRLLGAFELRRNDIILVAPDAAVPAHAMSSEFGLG